MEYQSTKFPCLKWLSHSNRLQVQSQTKEQNGVRLSRYKNDTKPRTNCCCSDSTSKVNLAGAVPYWSRRHAEKTYRLQSSRSCWKLSRQQSWWKRETSWLWFICVVCKTGLQNEFMVKFDRGASSEIPTGKKHFAKAIKNYQSHGQVYLGHFVELYCQSHELYRSTFL